MEGGGGGEIFLSHFLKTLSLIFRVDSESAKKIFEKIRKFHLWSDIAVKDQDLKFFRSDQN